MDSYEFRASLHRILAGRLRLAAAEQDLTAAAVLATRSMRRFADVMNSGDALDVAKHPDLADLNVRLDGFYDGPSGEQPDPRSST